MITEKEAAELAEQALRLAFAKFSSGLHEQAHVLLEQLLKVTPEDPGALQLMGVNLQALDRNAESRDFLLKCVGIDQGNPEAWNNLAVASSRLGRYHDAIAQLLKAREIDGNSEVYESNLGLQHRHLGDFDQAIKHYRNSLALKESAVSWAMLGGCHGEQKELEEAERCLRTALRIRHDFPEAHVDLASVLKLQGRWNEGFCEYEWRKKSFQQLSFWSQIYDPALAWDGGDIRGRRIIVHTEQGNGDTIMFARYLPLLSARGAHVVLHCSDQLRPLIEHLADETYTVDPSTIPDYKRRGAGERHTVPDHDFHCFLMSLHHLLGCEAIPACGYLMKPAPTDMSLYRGHLKVGLVWSGNPQHPNDRQRSLALSKLQPLAGLPGVKLFSLVKDYRPRKYHGHDDIVDLAGAADGMKVVDLSGLMEDYSSTARLVESMDLIVSVDTSVAHLAGALKKDCLLMLPWNPDWRWKSEGDRTDWYRSVTLLRQKSRGDWSHPVATAAEIVRSRASSLREKPL